MTQTLPLTKIYFLIIIVMWGETSFAQNNQIWFRHLDNEVGLCHNSVNAIYRDYKGFVWLGTPRGLCRYDGSGFKTYLKSNDANSISHNSVTSIKGDNIGNLWIATENGLNYFNRDSGIFHVLNIADGLPSDYVTALHISKSGALYIGTALGLCQLENASHPGVPPILSTIVGTQGRRVFSIAEDNAGNIWTGYTSEPFVSEYCPKNQRLTLHTTPPQIEAGISFTSVFVDQNNTIWTASRLSNLSKFDRHSNTFVHLAAQWAHPDTEIRDIEEDQSGTIWISTIRQGVVLYDKISNSGYSLLSEEPKPGVFSSNSSYSIYADKQGILWIGTERDGVAFNHPSMNRFKLYRKSINNTSSLSDNKINQIIVDDQERVWIGTDNGLNIKQKNSQSFQKIFNNSTNGTVLSSNSVMSLLLDKKGIMWIGTFQGGLNRYDEKTGRITYFNHNPNHPNSISMDNVWSLFEDSRENLWIGTLGAGLDLLDRESNVFKHFNMTNTGLSSNYISQIIETPPGDIWLATVYGLNVLGSDGQLKKIYLNDRKNKKSISNNHICSIFLDSNNNIWIGTAEGLNLFNAESDNFSQYEFTTDVLGNTINSILEDDNGFLWISTLNGIYKLQIITQPNRPLSLELLNHYDISDGLQGKEFKKGSGCRTHWGELYFGGSKGLTSFFPEELLKAPKGYSIQFTDLQIFNNSISVGETFNSRVILEKPLEETHEIMLHHYENIFNIALSTPDLINPQKVIFSYMLEGFNSDWIILEPNRKSVSFTNLNPGQYNLKVKATNSDGEWLEPESNLKITIKPPFWKTNLAFALFLVITITATFLLRKTIAKLTDQKTLLAQQEKEIKRQHELDHMKLRFFTNVSHEFRTPLTLLLSPVESLQKTILTPQQHELLSIVQKNAKKLLTLINQLLDLRKTEEHELVINSSDGDIISFCNEVVNSFANYSQSQGILLSVKSNISSFQTSFDLNKIERTISNLIANAIKFTPKGGSINIEMHIAPIDPENATPIKNKTHKLQLSVTDTGIGIQQEDRGHIFEPFYQAKTQNMNSPIGSGIGLSMVEKYVRMHDGTVELCESDEQGSKFTITIPLQQLNTQTSTLKNESSGNPEKREEPNVAQETIAKPSILLIEDNEDLRRYLKISLIDFYNILESSNGQHGIQLAMEQIPTLIVSDIMMSEADGLTLCSTLKTDERTCHIPIILLSAKTSEQDKIKGFNMGADDYITKPFNMELLHHKIRILIDKHIQLQRKMVSFLNINPSQINVVSMDEKLVKKAIIATEENISKAEFNVEMLARALGMSRVHLYKKTLAITGKSPIEFIRIIRLKRASQLLKESQLTVSEIAYEVGFNNPRYFSKYFKEEFGMLPSKYCNKYSLSKNRQEGTVLNDEPEIVKNELK